MTRGAFYHHFDGKKALFDAVVVDLQARAAASIERAAIAHESVWQRLEAGMDAYLDVCLEPAYGRIVIQEAPVVLGSERFREIEEAYPMALLAATFKALKKRGELDFPDVGLLTKVVDAMICQVALLQHDAGEPRALRRNAKMLISGLLSSLRNRRPAR